MKYHFETVLRSEGECFSTENVTGSVVDCVFHVHPEHELTWVESSFGVRFIGDNISEFRENDLVLVGPMLPHHYMNSPQDSRGTDWSRLKVIKFGNEFTRLLTLTEFESIRTMFEASASGLVFADAAATRIAPLLAEVFTTRGSLRLVRLLEALAILADSSYNTLSSSESVDFVQDERMDRVLDYIHRCLQMGKTISLSDTATVGCMTPQAFSRYFHKGTRKRFIDYVIELKIGRACGLLIDGDLPIVQVALSAGFDNLSNFNRHFFRLKKLSPRQYRKALQNAPRRTE